MQFISKGSLNALFSLCVCIPLLLAFASIFSTTIDSHIQSQPVMGVPLFLWLWIAVALSICVLILLVGSRLNFQATDDVTAEVDTEKTTIATSTTHTKGADHE